MQQINYLIFLRAAAQHREEDVSKISDVIGYSDASSIVPHRISRPITAKKKCRIYEENKVKDKAMNDKVLPCHKG